MKTYAWSLLVVLVLAAGLVWAGYHRGYTAGVDDTKDAADTRVAKADATAQHATAERDAATQTLADVRQKLAAQKDALENAHVYADVALADRNRLQRELDKLHTQRKSLVHETATTDPSCAALVHQPVCAAVARQLWGADGAADAGH